MPVNKRYLLDTLDDRDGGRHVVFVSMIDDDTGVQTKTKVCTFEPECKKAAEDYIKVMNSVTKIVKSVGDVSR